MTTHGVCPYGSTLFYVTVLCGGITVVCYGTSWYKCDMLWYFVVVFSKMSLQKSYGPLQPITDLKPLLNLIFYETLSLKEQSC